MVGRRQYSLFVRVEYTGRVKALHGSQPGWDRSARAFTPAVILFIALPEPEDKSDPVAAGACTYGSKATTRTSCAMSARL
jgi:hypothetical protein